VAASSPLVTRQPLSTLAETSPVSSSSPMVQESLRRLRRAHTTPDGPASESTRRYAYPRGQSLSPSPSPTKAKGAAAAAISRTAFTELMMGAQCDKIKTKTKKRSEFVEDQAIESDEDDMLGFGGVRKKPGEDEEEDEDEEHDADGVVKNLVDDAQMDTSTLAKAKVLEKHL
jgi:mediator of replication checkpoint protein 1